jgi:flagellar biosynthesis protein FliQ
MITTIFQEAMWVQTNSLDFIPMMDYVMPIAARRGAWS